MKTPAVWKKAVYLFIVAKLATATSFALAGNISGGGNTINHELIEDDAVDYSDLKGREAFEAKLKELRELAPGLADRIQDRLDKTTFYVIPREIAELPAEKTGLHFKSEQDAIQEGREVFINSVGNDARTDAAAGEMIMHEALMMSQDEKDARTVRQVMAKLYPKNPDRTPKPVDTNALLNALAVNNFGTFISPEQKKLVKAEIRESYLSFIGRVTKKVGEDCADPKVSLNGLRNTLSTGWSEESDKGGFQMERPWGAIYVADTRGFFSPFASHAFDSSIGTMHTIDDQLGTDGVFSACVRELDKMPKEVCAEFRKYSYDYEYNSKSPSFSVENDARQKAFFEINNERTNGSGEAVAKTLNYLTNSNPAFLNLMAISMDPKAMREALGPDSYANDRVKSILRRVTERQYSLDRQDTGAMRRLLCNSAASLQRDVTDLANDEEANIKAGNYQKPAWENRRRDTYSDEPRGYDDDQRMEEGGSRKRRSNSAY
jgi:hypothetical protein